MLQFTKAKPIAEPYEEIVSYNPKKQSDEISYDKLS